MNIYHAFFGWTACTNLYNFYWTSKVMKMTEEKLEGFPTRSKNIYFL